MSDPQAKASHHLTDYVQLFEHGTVNTYCFKITYSLPNMGERKINRESLCKGHTAVAHVKFYDFTRRDA